MTLDNKLDELIERVEILERKLKIAPEPTEKPSEAVSLNKLVMGILSKKLLISVSAPSHSFYQPPTGDFTTAIDAISPRCVVYVLTEDFDPLGAIYVEGGEVIRLSPYSDDCDVFEELRSWIY